MESSSNVAPIIIKKVKKGGGDGHHGGAWKVAYADFVTAMMAFFMLMWLLNATTEKQRKGIADYFAPTISVSRVSGGGDGAFGGESVFSTNSLARNGTGATLETPAPQIEAREDDASGDEDENEQEFKALEEALMGHGGESLVQENALKHIVTRVTDEGLAIEIFPLEEQPLFEDDGITPTPLLREIAQMIEGVARAVKNGIAVEGHAAAEPVVIADSQIWQKSAERADIMRGLLKEAGMPQQRLQRVTGHADREPAVRDPMALRNDRLEVILLRDP